MASTTHYGFVKLEVGQKEKEVSINTVLDSIDGQLFQRIKHLGDFATDPATVGVIVGSTYFNTTSLKLKFLRSTGTWTNVA